jgi:hypothetical protein
MIRRLRMLYKKIIAGTLVATTLMTVAPITSFASAAGKTSTLIQTQDSKVETNQSGEVTTQGVRKTALIYALRYGGDLLGKLLSNLSKKNGDYVKKYADDIADALERFENSIESNLIDFMYFKLDIPLSASRSIAWAIMQIIG